MKRMTFAAFAALTVLTGLSAVPSLRMVPQSVGDRRVEAFWQNGDAKRGERPDIRNLVLVVHPVPICDRPGAPLYVVLHSAGHDALSALDCTGVAGNHDIYHSPTNFFALYMDCRAYASSDWWWGAQSKTGTDEVACEKRVIDTVREVIARYALDENRVYLSGCSMGGSGTLGIGLRHGDVFAAIKANVPAIWKHDHPFKAMGWPPYVRPSDMTMPDPPFLVDYSAQNDAWSVGHERLIEGMRANRFGWAFFWGCFGHANRHAAIAEENDIIHDLDWLSIVRNAAYPVFTDASSDAKSPWPVSLDAADKPVVRENAAGQVNGYFRWRNVTDTSELFEMDVWLACPKTKIGSLSSPAVATANMTVRRLQRFFAERAHWSFGDRCGMTRRTDGVFDSVCVTVGPKPTRFRLMREEGTGDGAQPIPMDGSWKSGTAYRADRACYEFYPSNTVRVADGRYAHHGFEKELLTAFRLQFLTNVTVDFGGATVLLHGKLQPFVIDRCANVTIRNVKVRYDRSGYSQLKVESLAGNELTVRINRKKYPYRIEDGALVFYGPQWDGHRIEKSPCFSQFFDGQTGNGRCIALAFFSKTPFIDPKVPWAKGAFRFAAEEVGEGLVKLTSANDFWAHDTVRIGDWMVVSHEPRDICNCLMVESRDISLVNYRILNGIGMGIFPFHCRNILLDGLKMTHDAESPGLISNCADGVHAFACSGDFIVRNSVIEGTIDDALNVHCNFFTVKSVEGRRVVADTRLEPFATTALYLPGERIRIYRGSTLDGGTDCVIGSVRPLDRKTVEFELDREVPGHGAGDAIENLSTQCHLEIKNCRFGKANSHLRFQTRGGVLVEDCVTELPFLMTGDMNYWFESSPCEKTDLRNVRFVGDRACVRSSPMFCDTETSPHYHGELTLENCTFDADVPVQGGYVRRIGLKGCSHSAGRRMTLKLTNCGEVVAPGLEVVNERRPHRERLGVTY